MGSATLVFTMGRFLGLGTLALLTACLIVLVNSNIDHNLKELGQDDGLSDSLLKANPDELRRKRAAKESKGTQGSKKGKKKQIRKTKTDGKKSGGGKATKKRSSKTGGKGKWKSDGKKTKKNKNGGKKWKGNKKNNNN